jgi:hypothetical protein
MSLYPQIKQFLLGNATALAVLSSDALSSVLYLGGILGLMFVGIAYVSKIYHVVREHWQTVVSQLGRLILGIGPFYLFVQFVTLLILLLAANTSYVDFRRLC